MDKCYLLSSVYNAMNQNGLRMPLLQAVARHLKERGRLPQDGVSFSIVYGMNGTIVLPQSHVLWYLNQRETQWLIDDGLSIAQNLPLDQAVPCFYTSDEYRQMCTIYATYLIEEGLKNGTD